MATINNKLIHFKSKSDFNSRYAATTDGGLTYGDFLGTSIVFIQDAKQIWTHGQFYDANEATLASLGITATAAELNYMDGVTSNVQTQLNEIKESVDSISDPYEINLTNLLSAEDSESISTAIGGIDNLNATVQDNRIIVGTISNGSVSVSIRILGNVTTLYYLLDSVVGLTLNEVAITNTSGTLSKSVTTHSVLTENMVINSLNSDETTLPLSAAQGKALDSKINNIDVSADITNAINALDSSGQTASTGEVISSVSQENGVISVSKKTLTSDDIPELPQSKITDLDTALADKADASALAAKADASALTAHTSDTSNPHSVTKEQVGLGNVDNTSDIEKPMSFATRMAIDSKQDVSDDSLNTTNKTVVGAINELKSSVDDIDVSGDVQVAISQLDFSEVTASTGNMIGAVSQTDGVINVSTRAITADDIPEITISKVTDLQTELDSKQDTLTPGTGIEITPENQINVTLDTTVFKVVSVLPDSPAQGDENKIHLVPAESTGANNAYTEYVWVNSAWEILGEYTSEVDLTPYLKTVDAESTYLKITDAASEYATKTELAGKQDAGDYVEEIYDTDGVYLRAKGTLPEGGQGPVWKLLSTSNGIVLTNSNASHVGDSSNSVSLTINPSEVEDQSLTTTSKYITGAINEVHTELGTKQNSIDNNLDTTDKTIVGAINELLPKATGVGKIDPNSDGTGEIFNNYTGNKATGAKSHAEGNNTTASGSNAHAEGAYTEASGPNSHVEGNSTTASGAFSHAEGNGTNASGRAAHAEGGTTVASGDFSHAEGIGTIASGDGSHAEGQHNFDDTDAIHMVGIGTSSSDRKNAHVIKKEDGSHYIIGIGGYEGQATDSAKSLQEVINGKQDALVRLNVSTLFADSATISVGLSSVLADYGESTATEFPLMYAGASIGNIKPTWIRTSAGVTNFMCIADNKIWYFEIQGTTVQRASLAIS